MKQARSFLVIHQVTQSRDDLRGMTPLDALASTRSQHKTGRLLHEPTPTSIRYHHCYRTNSRRMTEDQPPNPATHDTAQKQPGRVGLPAQQEGKAGW